jgi:uncharacterized protein
MNHKIEFERVPLEDLQKMIWEPGPILSMALKVLDRLQAMLPKQTAARIMPAQIQDVLTMTGWNKVDHRKEIKNFPAGIRDVLTEFHIFSGDGIVCVFHPATSTLFRTNEHTAQMLKDAQCGLSPDEIGQKYGVSEGELDNLFAKIRNILETMPPVQPATTEGALKKLVLNVSNECNMRCRYCYAGGGNYGLPGMLMAPETARVALERIFAQFSRVGTILFFGGEPTLNPQTIAAACEVVAKRFKRNRMAQPRLGMVTNGLSLNSDMQTILQKYRMNLTISLDGMQSVHDQLRVTPNGQGTFERVAETIGQIQQLTGGREPSLIETTYTRLHQQTRVTFGDLIAFYRERFGVFDIHIPPVSCNAQDDLLWAPDNEDCAMVSKEVARLLGTLLSDQPQSLFSANTCLKTLIAHGQTPHLCGAGSTEITVMANGDVFPCYRFLEPQFRIGSVFDDALFKDGKFNQIQQYFLGQAKAHKTQCQQCWARNLCQVCLRTIQLRDESLEHIPDPLCDLNQSIAKAVLLTLARLQSDPEQWGQFGKALARIARKEAESTR